MPIIGNKTNEFIHDLVMTQVVFGIEHNENLSETEKTILKAFCEDNGFPAYSNEKELFIKKIGDTYYPTSKIDAIKAVRQATGLGLKEAKDLVDQEWERRDL